MKSELTQSVKASNATIQTFVLDAVSPLTAIIKADTKETNSLSATGPVGFKYNLWLYDRLLLTSTPTTLCCGADTSDLEDHKTF